MCLLVRRRVLLLDRPLPRASRPRDSESFVCAARQFMAACSAIRPLCEGQMVGRRFAGYDDDEFNTTPPTPFQYSSKAQAPAQIKNPKENQGAMASRGSRSPWPRGARWRGIDSRDRSTPPPSAGNGMMRLLPEQPCEQPEQPEKIEVIRQKMAESSG